MRTVVSTALLLALGVYLPGRAAALRIVSLVPSVTETLFAVGAGPDVVGVSAHCTYPPEVKQIDRIGTFMLPNIDAIVAKRPDIVIAGPSPANTSALATLEELGLRVLVIDPKTIDDIKASITRVADAVGRSVSGQAVVQRIDQRMQATRERLADAAPQRVLLVLDQQPLIAAGGRGFHDELIRMARGINVGAAAPGEWPPLSLELVVREAPDVIIDMTLVHQRGAAGIGIWSDFPTIPAVRSHRVHGCRADVLVHPGPRIDEAFALLAGVLHPERFDGEVGCGQ